MKKVTSWSVGFALVLGLSASAGVFFDSVLSSQVDSDDVYVSFHLDYLADKGEVDAETYLRIHGLTGSTVRLEAPWEARFEGKPMAEVRKRFSGWTKYVGYVDTQAPAPSFHFEYTDGKNRITSAQVPLAKADPVVPAAHLSRAGALTLTWSGPPAVAGEGVQGFLDTDQGEAMSALAVAGTNKLVFPADQLKSLNAGTARVRIIRTRVTELKTQSRRGGRSVVSYTSKDVQVTLD